MTTETLNQTPVDLKLTIRAYSNYLFAISSATIDDEKESTRFDRASSKAAFYDCERFISKMIEQFGAEKAKALLLKESDGDGVLMVPFSFGLYRMSDPTAFSSLNGFLTWQEAAVLSLIASDFSQIRCKHISGKKSPLTIIQF